MTAQMVKEDLSSQPRTALITGAFRGLGAAMAMALGRIGRERRRQLLPLTQESRSGLRTIPEVGGQAHPFQADVRNERQVACLVADVTAHFGPIDILVANATGPQPKFAIEDQTWQTHLDQLEFFVKSPLLLLKAVLPNMKQRRFGRVIHLWERGRRSRQPALRQ